MALDRNVFPESAIKCNQRTLSNKKKWWGRKVLGHLGRPKKLVTNIKLNIKRVVGKEGILITFSWVKKWDTSIFTKLKSVGSKDQCYQMHEI